MFWAEPLYCLVLFLSTHELSCAWQFKVLPLHSWAPSRHASAGLRGESRYLCTSMITLPHQQYFSTTRRPLPFSNHPMLRFIFLATQSGLPFPGKVYATVVCHSVSWFFVNILWKFLVKYLAISQIRTFRNQTTVKYQSSSKWPPSSPVTLRVYLTICHSWEFFHRTRM